MNELKAKKSLGQHFLRSETALKEIIDASLLSKHDLVLEIGPGEGVLTEALLASGAHVIAVETDERAITLLTKRFSDAISCGELLLIEGDIRNSETQEKLFNTAYLGEKSYKLIANIPYYITGYLFRLFLEILRQPSLMVFLVQKEVAEQIIAKNKKEGMLSLSVKAFGTPRYIATVERGSFSPPPKVDSAIVLVEHIGRSRFTDIDTQTYFTIVKAGLGSKRKMLLGNIAQSLSISRSELSDVFVKLGIPVSIRGEDLSIDLWLLLAARVSMKMHTDKEIS